MPHKSSRIFPRSSALGLLATLSVAVPFANGCSSDSATPSGDGGGSGGGGGACASPGGPAAEPADHHCEADSGPIVQATGACTKETGGDAGPAEATPGPWGGMSSADDDCKYDVSYTMTPVCEKEDVTVTVTVKKRTDHSALTGADPSLEVLDPSGLPGVGEGSQKSTEKPGGVYEIGPIHFNKPGKWTMRFHFFETCADTEDSPHGHAAFFIDVP